MLLVEQFHMFINKSITVSVENRGTNDVFVATGFAAGYAWNSALIDGTDIPRNIPVIRLEHRFPLDINVNSLPPLVCNDAKSIISYLRLTDSNWSLLLKF